MKNRSILAIGIFLFSVTLFAQGVKGGQISYRYISSYTYELDIRIYTETDSMGTERITLLYGGGTVDTLHSNYSLQGPRTTEWVFKTLMDFPTYGFYQIRVVDNFRAAGISNIPNSSGKIFELEIPLVIAPALGPNNSPEIFALHEAEIYQGKYIYNLPAYDHDGDSLAYRMMPASKNNYSFPPGAAVDSVYGMFSMPAIPGRFAVRFEIAEYRMGTLVGTMLREILVEHPYSIGSSEVAAPRLEVYPNPALHEIYVENGLPFRDILLFNTAGTVVLDVQNTDEQVVLSLRHLPKGVYYLKTLDLNGEVGVQKIIKE